MASVAFILYPFCALAWALFHPGPAGRPLPMHVMLVFYDAIPLVFGTVWLGYRLYKASLNNPRLAEIFTTRTLVKVRIAAIVTALLILAAKVVIK